MPTESNEVFIVDIGNTTAHVALFKGECKLKEMRVPTSQIRTGLHSRLRKSFKNARAHKAVIASVAPQATKDLCRIFKNKMGIETLVVGRDISVPIRNRYKNPRQVGVDRLLNAYAAYRIYKKEMLIIDFGTAITVDIVSNKGEYLGGVIAPGIEISLEALFNKTAMLPMIRLAHPMSLIGRDTVESIRVGCTVGIGGLCDRIVDAIKISYHFKPLVIATGGYASFMSRYCRSITHIHPDLVLEGMLHSYLSSRLK